MLSAILGIIVGATGVAAHWFMTKLRPGAPTAVELVNFSQPRDEGVVESSAADWKKRGVGDMLLTPMKDDYAAVIVHAVMEGNFYNVRLVSDPSKHMHVHASLLFSKEEVDTSRIHKN